MIYYYYNSSNTLNDNSSVNVNRNTSFTTSIDLLNEDLSLTLPPPAYSSSYNSTPITFSSSLYYIHYI